MRARVAEYQRVVTMLQQAGYQFNLFFEDRDEQLAELEKQLHDTIPRSRVENVASWIRRDLNTLLNKE